MATTDNNLHPFLWIALKSYVQVVRLRFDMGPVFIYILYDPLKYCEGISAEKLSKGYAMRTFSRTEGSAYLPMTDL
jgi:hypothetical protein